jgi:poly(3-hydroxybutyrate) depolymerase
MPIPALSENKGNTGNGMLCRFFGFSSNQLSVVYNGFWPRVGGNMSTARVLVAVLLVAHFGSAGHSAAGDSRPGPGDPEATGHRVLTLLPAELLSEPAAQQVATVLPANESLEWRMYVPTGYDPARPAGLLVYVSPTRSGEIPRGWSDILDRHNVIWIAAERSGNGELVARRILLALLAVSAASKHYQIDAERIYISGLSGGGKTASMVATDQAQLFRGAIYNCGVELWDRDEPHRLTEMRANHYVFVTGTYDQALEPTRRAFRAYQRAGIENSKLMVIRHMTHRNPDAHDFEEALTYLDSRVTSTQ